MATTGRTFDNSPEAILEAKKIGELTSLVSALSMVLEAFTRLASTDELNAAEGRRCILAATGIKYHPDCIFFFEVKGASIRLVDSFTHYNTYIAAPIDSIIRVLNGLWEGREDAFSSEWARGQAKIEGARSLHDGLQFNDAFKRVARAIKRYRAVVR